MLIDLYSDTKTKPTAGMRAAIANAEVGDSQKDEDPTVLKLQQMVAELVGMEAALFLPSGTMCNQIALKTHTSHGETVIADRLSHVLISEAGGPGLLSGVLFRQLDGDSGRYTPEQVSGAIQPGSRYQSPTTLLWAEQTNVYGGGVIWPLEQLQSVRATAREHGLKTHLDGARLVERQRRDWRASSGVCRGLRFDLDLPHKRLGMPGRSSPGRQRRVYREGARIPAPNRRRDATGRDYRCGRSVRTGAPCRSAG